MKDKNIIINEKGRTCTKCGKFLSWDNFDIRVGGANGHRADCKLCKQEYNRKYHLENKEKQLVKFAEYHKLNTDRILAYKKEHGHSPALYSSYIGKLTPYESPRGNTEGYLEVKCARCGKYFIPTNYQVGNRLRFICGTKTSESRLYCSEECKELCPIYHKIKYPAGFKNKSTTEYLPEFRKMILERDENTCQVCGEKFDPKELQAHHINPVVCSPMEQLDIENGICVCKECHKKLHDQDGCHYHELNKINKNKNMD